MFFIHGLITKVNISHNFISLFGMLFYRNQGCVTARTVANKCKYNHVTPILKSLNWLSVNDQLYFRDAVLAFKCMSGLAPGHLSDHLITRRTVSNWKTRNSEMLNIPLFRSATGQKTFHHRIVNIWNNLDNNIKLSINVNSFRNKPRGTLFDKFKRKSYKHATVTE